jgi:thiosulfate reductase / polysulfide reductase chain A
MPKVQLEITRRTFLKSGVAAGVAGAVGTNGMRGAPAFAAGIDEDAWYRQGEVQTTYNVCDMCPWHCGLVVRSVNGRVHKVDGNPKDPKSRGMLCPRGQGGVSFMYDPDRLQAPMVRTGERGEGKFREVEWEFALDLIAQKMNQIKERSGQEAVAFFGHTAGDTWWVEHLAQAWGSPNAAKPSSSLCISPRDEASTLMFGFPVGGQEPLDWEQLECLALIGSHIGEDARNTVMQDFAGLHGRGGTVIVVDPRFSSVATKADHWLPIKPGTDTALLLAWLHVLIDEDLYDADYVDRWTNGFDQLAQHVADKTPEWAAQITDLGADQIRDTARAMAAHAPRAAIMPGRHVTWYGNDTQRMRAVYLVNVLLGAYGREGGIFFNKAPYIGDVPHPPYAVAGSAGGCAAEPAEGEEDGPGPLAPGPTGKVRADGAQDTFLQGPTAMQELIDPMISGDPYRIEGLICYGVNLLQSIPNPERTKEALRNLELFVAIDVLPMEHIAWADIVLPEATTLERYEDLYTMSTKTPYIHLREPAVEPPYETKPGWWIAKELGARIGLDGFFRWDDIEEYLNTRLRSVGSSIEDLRANGGVITQDGRPYLEDFEDSSPFTTASGKIELWSQALANAGLDPLPEYEPTDEPPDGYYRLLYGRHPAHTFAKTQNTPVLVEVYPENEVWLNADEAAALGIADGDRVMLENQDGATDGPVKVKATQRIRRDAVFMVHGFGHDSEGLSRANGRGASDTKLQTTYKLDPVCGSAGMRVNFVRIAREA